MLVREENMGFQDDLGFVTWAVRKKKFLSLGITFPAGEDSFDRPSDLSL
jgi:hypothetical protein